MRVCVTRVDFLALDLDLFAGGTQIVPGSEGGTAAGATLRPPGGRSRGRSTRRPSPTRRDGRPQVAARPSAGTRRGQGRPRGGTEERAGPPPRAWEGKGGNAARLDPCPNWPEGAKCPACSGRGGTAARRRASPAEGADRPRSADKGPGQRRAAAISRQAGAAGPGEHTAEPDKGGCSCAGQRHKPHPADGGERARWPPPWGRERAPPCKHGLGEQKGAITTPFPTASPPAPAPVPPT